MLDISAGLGYIGRVKTTFNIVVYFRALARARLVTFTPLYRTPETTGRLGRLQGFSIPGRFQLAYPLKGRILPDSAYRCSNHAQDEISGMVQPSAIQKTVQAFRGETGKTTHSRPLPATDIVFADVITTRKTAASLNTW